MAKWQNDAMLDAALDYVADSDKMIACSQQPTTYAEAATTYALADAAMTSGDFSKANGDIDGRKLTVGAKADVTIDAAGTATHVALVKTTGSVLKYVTTCSPAILSAGGLVDFPAWDIELADAA